LTFHPPRSPASRSPAAGETSRPTMNDSLWPIIQLARQDGRYKFEAYLFVFEALNYAQKVLKMGTESPSEPPEERTGKSERPERHLTGQQLCEAIRLFALDQYGYMAQCVLNSWGVNRTGDFGEIVFNLIRIKQMRKTREDRREDFDDVFDFEKGLRGSFKITRPE
jgi:uncharacterized repeat protein (TIGR04138 family)